MRHDRFNHLVRLMLQNRRRINSIYQEYSSKKKADGFIVAVVNSTSSTEISDLIKEDYGCCIFSGETFGTLELWIYDLTVNQ